MRCPYCHNAEFVLPEKLKELQDDFLEERTVFNFLETRKGLLDGVAITGGEPTIHPDLPDFIRKVKVMGFLVKLDSNGTNPDMLEALFEENLLDYVAMDVKQVPEKYDLSAGVECDTAAIKRSHQLIRTSGVDHEFRTTVVPGIHSAEDIEAIAKWCQGAKRYTLQRFRNVKTLDPAYQHVNPFSDEEIAELQSAAEKYFDQVKVLG